MVHTYTTFLKSEILKFWNPSVFKGFQSLFTSDFLPFPFTRTVAKIVILDFFLCISTSFCTYSTSLTYFFSCLWKKNVTPNFAKPPLPELVTTLHPSFWAHVYHLLPHLPLDFFLSVVPFKPWWIFPYSNTNFTLQIHANCSLSPFFKTTFLKSAVFIRLTHSLIKGPLLETFSALSNWSVQSRLKNPHSVGWKGEKHGDKKTKL